MCLEKMDFAKEFRTFFNLYVHASDSSLVYQELQKLWTAHASKNTIHLDACWKLDDGASCNVIKLLKYLARRHGLPLSILESICAFLESPNVTAETKYHIATTLKYSLAYNETALDPAKILKHISTIQKQNQGPGKDDVVCHAILSQLIQCITMTLTHDNCDSKLISHVKSYLPQVDLKTSSLLHAKLVKLGLAADFSEKGQDKGKSKAKEHKDYYADELEKSEKSVFQTGSGVLTHVHEVTKKSGQRADVVKSQQAVTTVYKHNVSEKEEIEAINLAKALNSSRGKVRGTNQTLELTPTLSNEGESVRSYWRTTGMEVSYLYDQAHSGQPICYDDMVYLKDKFIAWGITLGFAGAMPELTRAQIGKAFLKISEQQVIPDNIIDALTEYPLTDFMLDPPATDRRLTLLRTLEQCRMRSQLPTKSEKLLQKFRKEERCNAEMRRILWRIFKKDDNNLHETFAESIEALCKYFNNKQKEADENYEQHLEYIAEQANIEQRANDLEEKQNFFEKLLKITTQDASSADAKKMQTQVGQIVCDYLEHESSPGLSKEWLGAFTKAYDAVKKDKKWDGKELPFLEAIIESILKTLNKQNFEPKALPDDLLNFLIRISNLKKNPKLEALILVSLGNLVIKFPNEIKIPNADLLSFRLMKEDTVDEYGTVHLSTEGDGKEDDLRPAEEGVTYVSHMTAHILLHYLKEQVKDMTNFKCRETTFTNILEALKSSRNKNTRILCAECLFTVVMAGKTLDQTQLALLQPFAEETESVVDVKIHCRGAYLTSLAQNEYAKSKPMTSFDLNWLAQVYCFEKLILDDKDFTPFVNPCILSVLEAQASLVTFTDLVFQLLTFNLSDTADASQSVVTPTLEILLKQLEATKSPKTVPNYCREAVENIFLSNQAQLPLSTRVIFALTVKLGLPLSDNVVEHIFRNLHDNDSNFLIMMFAIFGQDVADHVFVNFDLDFASARLLLQTQSIKNCPVQLPELMKNFLPHKDSKTVQQNLIETLLNSASQGIMASPLTLFALESSLSFKDYSEKALQALTIAAENGQTLSAEIIETIFERQKNVKTLAKIALALVDNNQTLPPAYLDQLISQFCSQSFATIFNTDEVNQTILAVLTKLLQNNRKFSKLEQVMSKFCQGFIPENAGNHRQRLEILAALSSLVNCGEQLDLDKATLKKVFVMALYEENGQLLETGLHGFIALNKATGGENNANYAAPFCDDSDFKLLAQIQRRPASSASVKASIAEFLSTQKKLPLGLQATLKLSNLENKTDKEFLADLPFLLQMQDHDFFQSGPCQTRMQILLSTNQNSDVLLQALQILSDYTQKTKLPTATYEAVTLAMVNNSDFEKVRLLTKSILHSILDHGFKFSRTMVHYLQTCTEFTKDLILKIPKQQNVVDPHIVAALEFECSLEGKKIDKGLKGVSPYLDNLKMGKQHFYKVLSTDLGSLKSAANLAYFTARHILKFPLPQDESSKTKAGKILEGALLDSSAKIQLIVFQAYRKVVEGGYKGEFKRLIRALTKTYTEKKCSIERKAEILETFSVLCKSDIGKPFITYDCVQLMTEELKGAGNAKTGILRKLSMQALSSLPVKNLKVDKKKQDELKEIEKFEHDFMLNMEELAYITFGEIFDTEDPVVIEKELAQDTTFVAEFLNFLYSLNYWDLKSLRGKNRDDWGQILLRSNFISTFTNSIDEQIRMQGLLDDIGSKCPEKAFFYFLQTLSLKCTQIPKSLVPVLLTTLSQLTPMETLNVLEDPEFEKNWEQETQEILLVRLLESKFQVQISPAVIKIFSERLVSIVGIDMAMALGGSLTQIQNVSSLEALISCFENHVTKEKVAGILSSLKPKLKPRHFTPDELKILVETQIILSMLPPGTPRKPRIERILKMILSNGILVADLRKLLDLTIEKNKTERNKLAVHKAFEHTIFQASQYKVTPSLFTKIVTALETEKKSKNVISLVDTLISESVFDGKYGAKDLEQIVKEFRLANSRTSYKWSSLRERFAKAGYQYDFLKLKILQVRNGDTFSKIYKPLVFEETKICDWDISSIHAWATAVKYLYKRNGILDNSIQAVADEAKLLCNTMEASEETTEAVKGLTQEASRLRYRNFGVKDGAEEVSKNEFYLEAMVVAKQAMKLHRNFDLTYVQILSCLLALQKLEKDQGKGQLQQVATGSGKSAIIAVLSVIKALEGHNVDVYTSSPVLAERDAKEWQKFYDIFGIQCDHNGDKGNSYVKGEKTCYRRSIVYGECSQFQFDFLRDKYSDLGTMGYRVPDFAIVDEVDAMLIDDSSKLARLSSTLPGMDLLEIIYHFLWDRIGYLKTHLYSIAQDFYYLEGQLSKDKTSGAPIYHYVDQTTNKTRRIDNLFGYIITNQDLAAARIHPIESVETYIKDHLVNYARALIDPDAASKSANVKLPLFLQPFAMAQIPKWVDSALSALAYEENVHYIVDQGQIKPVDFQTTGVVQGNTNWNNGLHQFLGLKHGLKIQPETVTTNFLSNLAMFKKYGSNVVGFTGTLGSTKGREVMYRIYNVKLLTLPETKFKRYRQFPDIVVDSEEEWMREIVISTLEETGKGRGVLVICETIAKAELVSQALSTTKVKVKVYTKNSDEGQSETQIERIHPGDVIVSTNLAGRGTDIKTLEIEGKGGLHVCLTFLPQSQRIEEQAFGRTSRQGNKGSGQLIICVPTSTTIAKGVDPRHERDAGEAEVLGSFESKEFPSIQRNDELFSKFCSFYSRLRSKLKEQCGWFGNLKEQFGWDQLGPFETTVLQSVEERWAMFLRQVDDGIIPLENSLPAFEEFESSMQNEVDSGIFNLLKCGKNCFYFIQLGHHEYYQGKDFEKAKLYFQTAVDLDRQFAAGGIVGLASVALRLAKGEYKEEAVGLYRDALALLYDEMAMITVAQSLVERQELSDDQSPLFCQLTEKSNLIGTFVNTVNMNIDAIERSLRRVHCTRIRVDKHSKTKNTDIYERVTVLMPNTLIRGGTRSIKQWKDFDQFSFTFRDLAVLSDMGSVDQAIQTLNLKGESRIAGRVPMDVKKWWSGVKFKVDLNCASCDLAKILDSKELDQELWSKNEAKLSIDILGLELLPESTKSLIELELLSAKVTSFDLEVIGPSKNLVKLVSDPKFNALGLCVEFKSVGAKSPEEVTTQILSSDETKRSTQLTSIGQSLISVKCVDLRSKEILNEVTKICQSVSGVSSYNLSLNGIEKNKAELLKSWLTLLSCYQQNVIRLQDLSDSIARSVIPLLRNLNIGFTMDVTGLTFKSAQDLLSHADLRQEDMKQSKAQQLLEMYMKDCLPLAEIQQLSARGLSILISFSEDMFIPWISIASLCALAALQVAAGGFLISTGFGASFGMSLITEGMSDFTYAWTSYQSRQLDWSSYGKQKAVSLAISAFSLGLSSLKDGAKGAQMLGKTVTKKATEAAAEQVFTATVTASGQNLSSLAVKTIAVSAGENVGRIGLKALTDNLTNFCFEQLRETIATEVRIRVEDHFRNAELRRLLSKFWALDNYKKSSGGGQLKAKIEGIVSATTNPKGDIWDTVGAPLCTGIFSNPNFIGGAFSAPIAFAGAVQGIYKIHEAIDKVFNQIRSKLAEDQINFTLQFQTHFQISRDEAEKKAGEIELKPGGETDFELIAKPSDKNVKEFFEKLQKLQKSFETASQSDLSIIKRCVVDLITGHIIKVANSHLVSPTMSKLGGKIIGKLSAELQQAFLVNEAESGADQNRVKELKEKDPSMLTNEEKEFLAKNDQPVTIASQIFANAKDYTVAYQRRDTAILAREAAEQVNSGNSEGAPVSSKTAETALAALDGAPADIALMIVAANAEGLNVKIVEDPNYKQTQEEIDSGCQVIVYEPPPPGEQVGHYRLKTNDGSGFVDITSTGADCGYAVLGHLAGKSVEEMRVETAGVVLKSGATFEKIHNNEQWMKDRYPEEASKFLMVGGTEREIRKSSIRGQQLQREAELAEKRNEADAAGGDLVISDETMRKIEKILDEPLSPGETEKGSLYSYTHQGIDEGAIKIGRTVQDPKTYVQGVANKNTRNTDDDHVYDLNTVYSTPYPIRAERIAHKLLEDQKHVIEGILGGKERYTTTPQQARQAIEKAVELVNTRRDVYEVEKARNIENKNQRRNEE